MIDLLNVFLIIATIIGAFIFTIFVIIISNKFIHKHFPSYQDIMTAQINRLPLSAIAEEGSVIQSFLDNGEIDYSALESYLTITLGDSILRSTRSHSLITTPYGEIRIMFDANHSLTRAFLSDIVSKSAEAKARKLAIAKSKEADLTNSRILKSIDTFVK